MKYCCTFPLSVLWFVLMLIIAPSKKGTSKLCSGPCARVRGEKKPNPGINFDFMFSFSFVSLTFLSLCSFITCVVWYFSFSNVSHSRNEKCVFLSEATAETGSADPA